MRIRLESDQHIEFQPHNPNLENIDVYVIAGDLGQYENEEKWLIDLTNKYPNVDIVCVSGNHSYYSHYYLEKVDSKAKELSEQYKKMHYLQNDSVVIEGIRFVASTLWTDFNRENPLAMLQAQMKMNDYKCIRYARGQLRLTPQKVLSLHKKAKEYIFRAIEESEEPTIVCTHHCPYSLEQNKISNLWPAFQVDMSEEMDELNKLPLIWCYGHDHICSDVSFPYYNNGKGNSIRFVSNQKGYPFEDTGFNPNLIIEI